MNFISESKQSTTLNFNDVNEKVSKGGLFDLDCDQVHSLFRSA